ncbi:MAG: DUF3473 domain-containing protein [Desulfovermiculus sp.]|nr:DUF3473 domain-containing protein [Desulfovermiculus sp.]
MHSNSIILTFDVEDWFQVENLRTWNPPSTWSERELRVEKSTHRILDLLDSISQHSSIYSHSSIPAPVEHPKGGPGSTGQASQPRLNTPKGAPVQQGKHSSISSTFFILGWIARRCPQLVREIHTRGHEVASHGDSHLLCTDMDPDDLAQDLARSKARLEDLIGAEVKGYRAPSFSVNEAVLDQIRKAGYSYDSSYNSFALHPRYGKMDFRPGLETKGIATQVSQGFWEVPISNLRLCKKVIPWGGGGYFRLVPAALFAWGVRRIVHTDGVYVLYLHPWEFDPDQPRVKEISWQFGFRHYVNLKKTGAKLEKLIQSMSDSRFVTCSDYLCMSHK